MGFLMNYLRSLVCCSRLVKIIRVGMLVLFWWLVTMKVFLFWGKVLLDCVNSIFRSRSRI